MTRITMAQLKEYARRGRVSQADVDRIIASQERGREALLAQTDAAIAAMPRIVLAEPVEFIVPIELLTANRLDAMQPIHRGRHRKRQRAVVRQAWLLHFHKCIPALPVTVTFTRCARRTDPHENLPYAFKHVTDEVTEMLGLHNDDTKEVTWKYDQEPRGPEPMRIRIKVEARIDA